MNDNLEKNLELLGRAAKAAQCNTCFYYPGMKGDVLAETIDASIKPSLNERNAFEFGYGACLAGAPTAVVVKAVGLASCLDSAQHAVVQGVGAGLVVVILEDTVAHSSPEVVDSRLFANYLSSIVIEPSSMENAAVHFYEAFELSRELDVPVFIRLTYDLLASDPGKVTLPKPKKAARSFAKPDYREKTIGFWHERAKVYEQKLDKIQTYIEDHYQPKALEGCEVIQFGYSAHPQDANVAVVEHYPIAASLKQLYSQKKVAVRELGSNYAQEALGGTSYVRVDNSRVPEISFPPFDNWEKALKLIDKGHYSFVVGDTGKFTLDSTGLVDVCLAMGSSIAIAAGMSIVTKGKNLAIIGDFSYLFNAYPSIVEAYHRGVDLDIVLLDDQKASSTGGQVSIASLNLDDVGAYTSVRKTYEYQALPASALVEPDSKGVAIYRIKNYGDS